MQKKINKIRYLAAKAKTAYKKEGLKPTLRRISQYIKIKGAVKGMIGGDENFDFVTDYRIANEAHHETIPPKNAANHNNSAAKEITLNWLIPDFSIGAGGHMTIFRIINQLEKHDIKNNIFICGPLIHRKKVSQFKQAINNHFLPLNADIFIGTDNLKEKISAANNHQNIMEAIVATSWETAYEAKKYLVDNNSSNKIKGFYFVQDFEPDFHAKGSKYLFAENTYKLGLHGITAGPWLKKLLQEKYNMKSDYFDLAYDNQVYKPAEKVLADTSDPNKFKICFYARPVTPRRAFELGIQSFRLALKEHKDLEIHFFGADTSFYDAPFKYIDHGVLSAEELSDLYSQMDLGVVFSLTNHSLIPKEMMACDLPVLELNLESNRHIFKDGENIFLSNPDPISIAKSISEIKNNSEKRKKIAQNAQNYVQQFSWEKSGEMVLDIVKKQS